MFTADRIQRERDEETQPRSPRALAQTHAQFTINSCKTRGEATRLRTTHTLLEPTLPAVPLPFLSTATKAEQYGRVVAFDRRALKRHKAHQRNAMKTTENLEQVNRELTEHLESLRESDKVERLSAFAAAFQEVVHISGVFSPLLQKIKDAYDHHLRSMISHGKAPRLVLPPISHPHGASQLQPSSELYDLKRQLHHLEVQCRVTLQENERLRQELQRETTIRKRVMEELQAPLEDPSEKPPTPHNKDYASKVEELQLQVLHSTLGEEELATLGSVCGIHVSLTVHPLSPSQIAEKKDKIAALSGKRSGHVPLSVCHQLEQCLREVEVETQLLHKRNKKLRQQIQDGETQLAKLMRGTDEAVTSKLWRGLQDSIS